MDALISGTAGIALLVDGDRLVSLNVHQPSHLVPREPSDLSFLFGDVKDIKLYENISHNQALQELEQAHNRICALDLALILLDPELSEKLRAEAALALEELLSQADVLEGLEGILYARPLPASADVAGGLACCVHAQAKTLRDLLDRLKDYQQAIRVVSFVWQAIPPEVFADEKQKARFFEVAISKGLFRNLAIASSSKATLESFLAATLNSSSLRTIPSYQEVLRRWVELLSTEPIMARRVPVEATEIISDISIRDIPIASVISERDNTIRSITGEIENQFGAGSVMQMGKRQFADFPAISTSCLSLDVATGIGGVPRGRIVEIYGPESSGKTTIGLHIAFEAQKQGGVAAYIDAEHALDAEYAEKLGVKVDDLVISQPDSGEQALDIAEALVRSGGVDVILVDSVAALIPRAELAGEMADLLPDIQARLMSQALRKLTAVVSRSNTCLIFINQIREKIGVMFGSSETTTGGRALKFYSAMRLEFHRIGPIKQGDLIIGARSKVKVVKNKLATPFKETEFDLIYGKGISRESDILDLAVKHNIIQKSGASYSLQGETLGRDRNAVTSLLEANRELTENIKEKVWRVLRPLVPGSGGLRVGQVTDTSGTFERRETLAKNRAADS